MVWAVNGREGLLLIGESIENIGSRDMGGPRKQFPGSISACVVSAPPRRLHLPATMPRTYTPSILLTCLSILTLITFLVNAHLIEVPAGKKECFFEDLHVHDKVHISDAAELPDLTKYRR